ncbi:MAG: alanine racemase, partial [Kiritimatiellae bacterium]|nr:alanine racemase [Kiritimatiellia bacterium]
MQKAHNSEFHRAWLEVDTGAFASNLAALAAAAAPASLLAVLKADAYGLGAAPLADAAMR